MENDGDGVTPIVQPTPVAPEVVIEDCEDEEAGPSIRHVPQQERESHAFTQYTVTQLQKEMPNEMDTELYQRVKVGGEIISDKEKNLEMKCFPMLYPKGRNGPDTDRNVHMRAEEYFKNRMHHSGGIHSIFSSG